MNCKENILLYFYLFSALSATVLAKSLLADRRYCGYQHTDDYIRTSNKTAIDEFPWMAQLLFDNYWFRCVGSLISNRYVLTAAHCLGSKDFKLVKVRLGDYNIQTEIDCVYEQENFIECSDPLQLFDVDEKTIHPVFNATTGENDIALIRLSQTVTFTDYIRPICLPKGNAPELKPGEMMTISGWSCLFLTEFRDYFKKRILATFVSDEICTKHYNNTKKVFNCNHLCIQEVDSFTCVGDSGSPLMYPVRTQWEQVGILLYGKGYGIKFPTVFTKVSNYLIWIEENLRS